MPFYRRSVHTRPYPHWYCRLYQNAPNTRYSPRVPSLRSKILAIREASQKPCCACFTGVPCGGRGPGYGWAMQAFEQDGTQRKGYRAQLQRSSFGHFHTDAGASGSIQCSPCATSYWKGCEGVPKILDNEAEGLEGAPCFRRNLEVLYNSLRQIRNHIQF